MNATVSASSSMIVAGASPPAMAQKTQSATDQSLPSAAGSFADICCGGTYIYRSRDEDRSNGEASEVIARKDRVGVVGFGGVLRGLGPRLGTAQLYRVLDALIGSEVVFSYAHKEVRFVPRQLLPAQALVIAISSLADERSIGALFDLRARGFDLAILDVSPVPFTAAGRSPSEMLAHRLWLLQRDALRARFEQLGVAVTEWRGEEPLQVPVAMTASVRRRVRYPVAA